MLRTLLSRKAEFNGSIQQEKAFSQVPYHVGYLSGPPACAAWLGLSCSEQENSTFINISEVGMKEGWPMHSVGSGGRQGKSWEVIVGGLRGENWEWGSKMWAAAGRESESQELLPLICSPAHKFACLPAQLLNCSLICLCRQRSYFIPEYSSLWIRLSIR